MGKICIGISGWRYKGWRGVFYPSGLQQRRELEFASRAFNTIEINGTFYSLQRPEHFSRWAKETPEDFVFALKGSRFITHMKKLRDVDAALANFFASGILALEDKMGPILWQLPPQMQFDPERLKAFLKILPRTTRQAANLARRCDARLDGRSLLTTSRNIPLRHCLEIRHESFVVPEFIDLLRELNIGLVVADTVEWPLLMDITADFVYVRLHGSEQLYASGYERPAISLWAQRVIQFASGEEPEGRRAGIAGPAKTSRDVYVYFDNDAKVRAPFDAQALQAQIATVMTTPNEESPRPS